MGLAIVSVVLAGFAKLWWTGRIIKKQRKADEAKTAKLRGMRESGQLKVMKEKHNIPFGVRAIESGIEVDGVWQSGVNTPIPENIKVAKAAARLAEAAKVAARAKHKSNLSSGGPDLGRSSEAYDVVSNYDLSSQAPSVFSIGPEASIASVPRTSTRRPASYRQKRSSRLRFSDYGQNHFNQETLDHLEPRTAEAGQTENWNMSGSRRPSYSEEAIAEGNDRPSASISDLNSARQCLLTSEAMEALHTEMSEGSTRSRDFHADLGLLQRVGLERDYLRVPLQPPPEERPDLSEISDSTVLHSPPRSSYASQRCAEHGNILREPCWPILSDRNPSARAGSIHMNRSVRRPNPAFEILPAGTFGNPVGPMGQPSNDSWSCDLENGYKRHSKRLQKKKRASG